MCVSSWYSGTKDKDKEYAESFVAVLSTDDVSMASSDVLTHPRDVRALSMKGDKLKVQGTGLGITPRVPSPSPSPLSSPSSHSVTPTGTGLSPAAPPASDATSRASLTSDDDVTQSVDEEADSMLQGVVSMNQILEGQIEALRLRLHVEDKQHRDDKNKLRQEKDTVIRTKESEIEDLHDSLKSREERIHSLLRASDDKDRIIQGKVSEIEELKKMVKESEDYAHKLHRQIGHVRHKKQTLETDTLYKEQNDEIRRLNDELRDLKDRLGSMETELKRATSIMEQQTSKIKQLEDDRGSMHSKFKEELEKATRAMRQEVERMREVMRQNYEEMKMLRDQNRQMHSDVRDIKQMLINGAGGGGAGGAKSPPSVGGPSPRHYTGVQRPFTASRMTLRPADALRGSPSPSRMVGMSGAHHGTGIGGGGGGAGGAASSSKTVTINGGPRTTTTSLSSPAAAASGAAGGGGHIQHPPSARDTSGRKSSIAAPAGGGGGGKRPLSICSLKDGPTTGLPSISRQTSNLQRNKSAVRLSSGKPTARK